MGESISTILAVLLGFCFTSLTVMATLTLLVIQRLRRVWRAGPEDIRAAYIRYRQHHPRASDQQVLQHVIRQQARRCGLIGIVTGFGGFLTMVLALPIDLYLTGRIQADLAQFIARHYGQELNMDDPALASVRDNLSMTVEAQFMRSRQRVSREARELVIRKMVSKFVPFFGAFLGYHFNYHEARETGLVVLKHYASRRPPQMLASS